MSCVISAGVLITGGYNSGGALNTAEIYLPSSGASCILPQLPQLYSPRFDHTVEQTGLLCGGSLTTDTCLQWSSETSTWEPSLTLNTGSRTRHVSWTPGPAIGTYLIGGGGAAGTTSSLIKPDGSQEPGFTLNYNTTYVKFY